MLHKPILIKHDERREAQRTELRFRADLEPGGGRLALYTDLPLDDLPWPPSDSDVKNALSLFYDDLLVDFPFKSQMDRAHAMAAFLLPFVRGIIYGHTPWHVFTSPVTGSGNTLLCNLIGDISGPGIVTTMLNPRSQSLRLDLISLMNLCLKNKSLLNEIHHPAKHIIRSKHMVDAVVRHLHVGKGLFNSSLIPLNMLPIWWLHIHNETLEYSLARVSMRIKIVPNVERPWLNRTFKHDHLEKWAKDNRKQLVRSCLIMIYRWICDGCPPGEKTLWRFAEWSKIMGGILSTAGVDGFLGRDDESGYVAGSKW